MSTPGNRPQTRAEIIRQFLPTSPYVGHLGIQLTGMQPDVATLTLPFADSLITIGTTIHGGALASLVDTAPLVGGCAGAALPPKLRGANPGVAVTHLPPAAAAG